uniref:Histidine kinase/HSP90-like ATPase domain-containing protein n=1 Tax=Chromera velia CCMP2878 TaxID=1169474 RepID=A0A0G4FHB7_9ALVE|mmetsp:Transcript_40911/g.80636  ORF Transcript_40911/g.80636 Transcript_40911/m.80636 type:complete len:763 (-) Transcript_40911:1073-3361(-)|eukprot:Cvel_17025.t1-p1 / transcript=Cvel_17025.t1 / gene=Cvel_17025 / organism=Chromera_velia_CCMP2878 / gene_product=Heat shock-like 85 kDa protein, putative / transcript_product=Heat shock-like 85 kDa protein, putative / location=Cvel_scaffold1339:13524-20045(-) / protein_length=762 / sequence_SO=supercontig / SO=protein_coding / is_pseudo=false
MSARVLCVLAAACLGVSDAFNLNGAGSFGRSRRAGSPSHRLRRGFASLDVFDESFLNSPSTVLSQVATATAEPEQAETYAFQAEVSRVMDIIINSLYTDKDVFLRELVSNAADACDKRKVTLTSHNLPYDHGCIKIRADKRRKLLIVEDTGIGMNKTELINNLGTIAQSGTAKFLQQVADGQADASLIGQFGVGFYSAYLVADQVEVVTRKDVETEDGQLLRGQTYRWRSNSEGTFTVFPEDEEKMDDPFETTGTRVILHLKEEADEYMEDYKIKELLRKYSEFIQYPISVWSEKVDYERVPDPDAPVKPGDPPRMKTVTKRFNEWERVNLQPPIWRRDRDDLSDDDYFEFYKSTFKSYDDPTGYIHFKVEGQVEFSSVLFIPGSIPWELTRNMFDDDSRGIRLYVKRVFINDKFAEAIPRWLTFIRGVVDSEDLPLNVGREILQKSKMLTIINKRIAAKAIDMIREIRRQGGDKWDKFWENFGKYLKVGVVEDRDHKEQIAQLLQFYSSKSGPKQTTLDEYVSRMKANQTAIYYVAAESRQAAAENPLLEKLRALDYEIMYMTEPLDEFCMQSLQTGDYMGKQVVDINKDDLRLPEDESEDEKERKKQKRIEMENLCDWLENYYGKTVQKVRVSERLTESPVLLVQGEFGISPSLQKYIKQQAAAQGTQENEMYGMAMNQLIVEVNAEHPIVEQLNQMVLKDRNSRNAKEVAKLLFDVASLQGGYTVNDPGAFAKGIVRLMKREADTFLDNLGSETEATES